MISLVSNFNFNWMTTYVYADDVAPLLPKGTILKVTAWHDNTAAKKTNPDPNQWVGWGDRTVDEMAHAWINIVYMKDEDFKAEQEKRRTPTTQSQAPQQQTVTLAREQTNSGRRPNRRLLCFSAVSRARTTNPAPPKTSTSELVDVVYLVMQAIWADMRRSRRAIEPSQWATLRRIARGPCTMSELARHKGVSLPTISKSVDMLVRRGWVERFVDDTDRRQTLVRLTAGGRRVLAECRRRVELRLDEKLATLSAGRARAGDRQPAHGARRARRRGLTAGPDSGALQLLTGRSRRWRTFCIRPGRRIDREKASTELTVLRARQVVNARKVGNQVYYSLRDPVLVDVLDLLKKYFYTHLNRSVAMLDEMDVRPGRRRRA